MTKNSLDPVSRNFGMTSLQKFGKVPIPDRRQSKTLLLSMNVDKNGQKQSFRLPFVASRATNGNRKHCF